MRHLIASPAAAAAAGCISELSALVKVPSEVGRPRILKKTNQPTLSLPEMFTEGTNCACSVQKGK